MSYRTTVLSATQAHAVLPALLEANLHPELPVEERLSWVYDEGPLRPGEAVVLEHTRAPGQTPTPVGCLGLRPLPFVVRGQPAVGVQMIDLAVARAHRTLYPSRELQRGARERTRAIGDFAYGLPNDRAVAMQVSLGYLALGGFRRWARPLRAEPFLRRTLPTTLARIAGGVADTLDRALTLARSAGHEGREVLSWDVGPDDGYDLLWRAARTQTLVLGERSPEVLTWRFGDAPGPRHRFVSLREGGFVRAYAVVQTIGDAAHLRDLFGVSPTAVAALLDRLLATLRRASLRAVSFNHFGASWLPALLVARGFRPRDEQRAILVDVPTTSRLPPEALRTPEAWYLTDFDEPG